MSFTGKSSTSPSALTVERGRGGERRGRPDARSKSRTRFRSKSRDGGDRKTVIKCWKCGKEGHVKRDCPEEQDGNKGKSKASASTHIVVVDEEADIL